MMNNVIRCVIDMSICDLYHELEGKGVYVLEKVILYDMVKSVIDFCNLSNKEVDDFLEICIDFYKNEILNRDDMPMNVFRIDLEYLNVIRNILRKIVMNGLKMVYILVCCISI